MSRVVPSIVSLLLSLASCAKLEYVKVPSPTQYADWTDEDQRRADAMEGVRYYLPRPFLHLEKSTPVAQRVAFVTFVREEDEFRLELPEDAPTWVRRLAPRRLSVSQVLAANLARVGGAEQQTGGPRVGPEVGEEADERPPSELTARTGFLNETDPVTHLSDRMNVVYLPDLEEQYVIRATAGLGRADIETRLRHGWAAEVFGQQIDNSNLIPYVLRQVERASDVAAGIAATWVPAGAGTVAAAARGAAQLQAGEAEDVLGQVYVFKIAEVKTAQPGLYPILKPREVRDWLRRAGVVSGDDPQATFEEFLRQNQTPWIRPDMAFVPCPPFTMIAFNVTTDAFLMPATQPVTARSEGGEERRDVRTDGVSAIEEGVRLALGGQTLEEGGPRLSASDIVVSEADSGQPRVEITVPRSVAAPDAEESTRSAWQARLDALLDGIGWDVSVVPTAEPHGTANTVIRFEITRQQD